MKRKIVCLCGSTRFSQAFHDANLSETLAGNIVLTICCDMRSDDEIFASMTEAERSAVKTQLDELHLDKIMLANEVLVLNVGGYVGDSTRREVIYALAAYKKVRWLEPDNIPAEFATRHTLRELDAMLIEVERRLGLRGEPLTTRDDDSEVAP